jgi:tRNA threonylcarbamoyladenosine biosynthesis protein TsaB
MRILAVETATSWQSVAIVDGDTVVARSDEDAAGSHARRLVPSIDWLLTSCGMVLTDMDGLAVSIGPGSFTGLRVGLATMMGFRSVTGLPLAAVPTLEAMAWNLRGSEPLLCPMIRARTGEVYWAQYQWLPGSVLKQMGGEQVSTVAALAQSLSGPVLMFGEGWELYKQDIRRLLDRHPCDLKEAPSGAMRPSAVSVGRAGGERLRRGEMAEQGLSPRYVQRAEAEILWERRGATPPMTKAARRPGRRKARAS